MNRVASVLSRFLSRNEPTELPAALDPRNLEVRQQWFHQWGSLFGPNASTGLTVTEEQAFRLAPVSQAVQLISEEIATLPLEVKRVNDQAAECETAYRHPAYRLLRWNPAQIYHAFQARRIMQIQTLLYGNGIGEIVRDASYRPVAIWPLEPWRVDMYWWEVTGSERRIQYRYTPVQSNGGAGGQRIIQPEDVVHIRAMDSQIGLWGDSPVLRCAGALGLTQAAQDFAAAFFNNGTQLSGVLEHPGSLGEEAFKSLKQSWAEAHQGGAYKAFKPAILEEGMQWKPTSQNAEESQLTETRDAQVKEVARVFNIPPHRLGASTDSFTYSNETQERHAFYTSTIRPWAVQWEQELNMKLLGRGFRAEFDFSEAMRADMKSRNESYAIAHNGWMTTNEIRKAEGLNPIEGGDEIVQNDPVEPSEDAGDVSDDSGDDDDARDVSNALRPILRSAVERVLRRQVRQLEGMHEDKREDFFANQLDAWSFALGPVAVAYRGLGLGFPEPEEIANRFTELHASEIGQGVDPATWSVDDIMEEILCPPMN